MLKIATFTLLTLAAWLLVVYLPYPLPDWAKKADVNKADVANAFAGCLSLVFLAVSIYEQRSVAENVAAIEALTFMAEFNAGLMDKVDSVVKSHEYRAAAQHCMRLVLRRLQKIGVSVLDVELVSRHQETADMLTFINESLKRHFDPDNAKTTEIAYKLLRRKPLGV